MLINNEGSAVSDLRQQHEIFQLRAKKREIEMSTIRYYTSHSLSKSVVKNITYGVVFFLHASFERWQI